MKKTLQRISVVFVLLAFICAWTDISAQQLQLHVSLEDTTYLMCEPIWLDVELINISEDTVRVWGFGFPGGRHLKVVLTDEQDDKIPFRYQLNYRDMFGFILDPGETYFEAFSLSEIFWNYDTPTVSFRSRRTSSLAPGSYHINAQYQPRYGSDTISIDPIHFEVVEPTGFEREALDLFLEINRSWDKSDHDKAYELLNKLEATHPKSVYLERAYMQVFNYDVLLEKKPNTGYLLGRLHTLVNEITDEQQKREFLEGIIHRHPGTRTAKYAEQELRRIQRGE